jgi:diguanylate cyclase (GGDEF)-like protein/PAS domain S-box-containing protein
MANEASAINMGSPDRRRRGVRFSKDNYKEILEFYPGLACICQQGKVLSMNRLGGEILAITDNADLVGTTFDTLFAPDYQGVDLVTEALLSGLPTLAMLQRADGSKVGVEVKVHWARELGEGSVMVQAEDISHRMNLSADVLHSENRFRRLIENAQVMICAIDDGRVVFINRAGRDLLRVETPVALVNAEISSLFHPDYGDVFGDPEVVAALVEEREMLPAKLARHDRTFVDVHIAVTRALGDKGYMLEVRDISEHRKAVMALHHLNQELEERVKVRTQELEEEIGLRREAEDKLRHMATHDTLTALPNRRLLMDRLSGATHRAHRQKNKIALMFIDLDGFKAINDTYGHEAGDAVLICVAERLISLVRETDTVARLGGDEFVILYTDIHVVSEAETLAKNVLSVLAAPISLQDGQMGTIGGSIGIAVYPDHGANGEALMKVADDLMYKVKKQGKNSYLVAQAMTDAVAESSRLSAEIS